MNCLGLDIGEKRIGVAVSRGDIIAVPLATIEVRDPETAADEIIRIIREEGTREVVYGLPLDQHGETGPQAGRVERFIVLLRGRCQRDVKWIAHDESFTTRRAGRAIREMKVKRKKRKKIVDRIAAVLILQDHLDHGSSGPKEYNRR